MAFSSGTFSRLHDWTTDRDAGIKKSASRTDAEFDGIATGLTTCILKDGTQTLTAMIPFTLGLSVPTDKKIQLRDSAIFINSSGDGQLDVVADTEIELTAPTVDIAASTAVTIATPSLIITDNTTDEPIVQIKNTHNGTTAGELRFVMDKGAAGADGDDLGTISFYGDDAGQNQTAFAKIVGEVSEADETDEAGKLSFFVAESDGTNTALTAGLVLEGEHATDGEVDVTIGAGVASTTSVAGVLNVAGGAVFNEDSADVDFRVESNGQTHALFVDGGNDSVLIGMDDVAYAVTNEADNLIVGNPSDALTGMTFVTSASGYSGINFSSGNSGNDRLAGYIAYDHSADEWVFGGKGNGTTLFKIHDNGRWEQFGCDTTSQALHIKNDGNNTNRKGMIIQCGTDDNSGTNTALSFDDGNGSGQGSITFSGGTVSYGAFTAHHEISLPNADTSSGYDYGTLVEIDEIYYAKNRNGTEQSRGIRYLVKKSSSAYSKKVLGAYCGDMPEQADEDGTYKDNLHQTAVLGDGHIICNGEKGNISVGDGITTSSTAGIGMKADKLCMIVGIAQEDITFSSVSETKLVAVQYGVRQFTAWTD